MTLLVSGLFFGGTAIAQTPTVSGDDMLCPDGTGTLTTQTFDSYQWLRRYYGSTVTDPIPGETSQSLVMDYYDYAASYMSVATTLGGVADTSAEFFVDGYAFLGPYVISDGDFTVGMSGESILCPGSTMTFEFGMPYTTNITWYLDGNPIPGETSSILTVSQPGSYYVEGAPAVCPDYIQGPGVSLDVVVLDFAPIDVTLTGDFTTGLAGQAILCPGKTLSLNLQNPYDTDIVWYKDGNPIAGVTAPTLSVNTVGIYTVEAAPADCPNYIQTFSPEVVVEVLTFAPLELTVSGDYTDGPNGEYMLCDDADEVIITLGNPYDTDITWYNNATVIVGENSQTLTVTDPGSFLVSAAPAACPDFMQNTIIPIVVTNCGLGLEDDLAGVKVDVFPNPASANLTVQIAAEFIGSTYELLDQAGRKVQTGQLLNTQNSLETAELQSGMYVLRVNGNSSTLVSVQH